MIEAVLEQKHVAQKTKWTVKTLISAGIIALAVVLPQLAHGLVGERAGVMLLPMYLPVLLGGCLLGARWGLGMGVLSPLVSYLLTSAAGVPMPALARLPFMMAELAVFACVSGLFANTIVKKAWLAFPAVVLAQVCGRASFLLLVALFGSATPFTTAMIWSQIQAGAVGLAAQAVLVPLMVMGLRALLWPEKRHD